MTEQYLAVCAMFRDEAPYLAEWIAFHQLVGVEHFYLYNNNSSDDYLAALVPFVDEGLVSLCDWPIPFHQRAQRKAYVHCLGEVRHKVRWLAFIDIDEFLFSPPNDLLSTALQDFEHWPGVVVNWQTYGSSGKKKASGEPVIERFTRRAPANWVRNRMVKSIVQPARTIKPAGVHHFDYADNCLAVDENGNSVFYRRRSRFRKKLKPWFGKLGPILRHIDPYSATNISKKVVTVDTLRINHYPVKSLEEFRRKSLLKKEKQRYESIDYFAYHDRNEVHDPVLMRVLPALKSRLMNLA